MDNTNTTQLTKPDFRTAVSAATSLDELVRVLNTAQPEQGGQTHAEEHLMTHLPTFGGEDVRDTHNVWSWDATRMIVQQSEGFRIVPRVQS